MNALLLNNSAFEGQNILVTGGASGIGRKIVLKLAELGALVFINYNKSEKEAYELEQYILNRGGKCVLVQANLLVSNEVQAMFDTLYSYTDRLDALVNNSGILIKRSVINCTENDWDKVIDTNLKGAFLCSKYAIKNMIIHREGSIVNILSTIINRAISMQGAYTASKAGLMGLTKVMAKEFGPMGIRVNAVSPGPVLTDLNNWSPDEIEKIRKQIPLNKMTSSEDVANVVIFLLSQYSKQITGEIINIDGGLCL